MEGGSAEIEFVTALEGVNGENMEDYLVYLSSQPPVPDEREVSFRLLRHYASSRFLTLPRYATRSITTWTSLR